MTRTDEQQGCGNAQLLPRHRQPIKHRHSRAVRAAAITVEATTRSRKLGASSRHMPRIILATPDTIVQHKHLSFLVELNLQPFSRFHRFYTQGFCGRCPVILKKVQLGTLSFPGVFTWLFSARVATYHVKISHAPEFLFLPCSKAQNTAFYDWLRAVCNPSPW